MEHKEYFVAFFDVLGFEDKLNTLGLDKMINKYELLISVVSKYNEAHRRLKEKKLHGAFWAADGGVMVTYEIRGAYASDSIIIWAQRELGGAGMITGKGNDMKFVRPPVPCDAFLNICNEILCQSIEVGLPLRGALAMGKAHISEEKHIYLGLPFVETARLEKGQEFIGSSPCRSFNEQPIPPNYILPYKSHLKENAANQTSGSVLDWPRHWRDTRDSDASEFITDMYEEAGGENLPESVKIKYKNTLKLIVFSRENSKYWEDLREGCEPNYG